MQICESKAQLSDDTKVVETSGLLGRRTDPDPVYLETAQRDNHVALRTAVGTDIAVLDITTAEALRAIKKLGGTRFEYFITTEDIATALHKHKRGDKGVVVALNIVFYGPPNSRAETGRTLSRARLYLQNPSHTRKSYLRYDNPHVLRLTNDSSVIEAAPQPLQGGLEVEVLLQSLDHRQELEQRDVSGIVTSSLKR